MIDDDCPLNPSVGNHRRTLFDKFHRAGYNFLEEFRL
jgi:hypothetical protein